MIATHYFPLCWLSPSCPHVLSDKRRWSRFVVHSTVYVCRSKHLLMQNRAIIYAAFQPSRANGQPFILALFNYLWNWFTEFCGKPTSLSIGSRVTCNCLVMQLRSGWNVLRGRAAFNTSWVGTASSSVSHPGTEEQSRALCFCCHFFQSVNGMMLLQRQLVIGRRDTGLAVILPVAEPGLDTGMQLHPWRK